MPDLASTKALGGEYVTKAQMLLWLASAGAFIMTAMWVLLLNHSSVPHALAVHRQVFEQVLTNQAEWRDEQRSDNAEIKAQIQQLRVLIIAERDAP